MFNVQFMFNSFTIQCSIQCNTSCSIQCNFTNKGILLVSGGGQGFTGGTDWWWGVGEVTHVSIIYLLIKPSMLWLPVSVYNVCWWCKNGLKIHSKNCQKINQENVLWFLCKGICAFWQLGNQGGHMNWWGTQKLWGRGEGTLRSSDKHLMREEPGVLKFPSGGEFLQYLNPMGLYWIDLTEPRSRRWVYGGYCA